MLVSGQMRPQNKVRGVSGPAAAAISVPAGLLTGTVFGQVLAVVGLGAVLGLTFNAANPLGIRIGAGPVAPVAASPQPETPAAPPVAAVVPKMEAEPPVRTTPQAQPQVVQVTEQISMAPLPPALPAVIPAPHPPVAAAHSHSVGVSHPPVTEPNPAPTHWPEVKAWMAAGQAVVVDVRHKPIFDAGHIPGAVSLPEASPPELFRSFLDQQPTNMIVVLYCSSTSCSQSARVANRLVAEYRWSQVRYMTGGYQEYQQLELAKPTPTPPAQP
jgi:rhodanese-related sulfurtransferase